MIENIAVEMWDAAEDAAELFAEQRAEADRIVAEWRQRRADEAMTEALATIRSQEWDGPFIPDVDDSEVPF